MILPANNKFVRKEGMIIKKKTWKVGELAYQTGLTVRTLHHYDRIGLLSPSRRSDSGHRAYTESDIAKLQQIMSLKQLGFALEEIKSFIENPRFNPVEVLRVQLESVKENLRLQEQLCNRLEEIYGLLNSQQDVKVEDVIKLIEVMNMQKYFPRLDLSQ